MRPAHRSRSSAASGCWPPGWSISPRELVLEEAPLNEPIGHRRVFTGEAWHDDVPVYDGDALRPGAPVVGPALVQSRFTTIVLAAGDVARMQPNGDVLIEVAPA